MSLWGAISGHANIIVHAAGWLEGGLTASFEKLIVDAEMLQMMAEYLRPIEVNDDTLALEAIAEEAMGRKTGARGLRTIMEQILLDIMYDLPSMDNVSKVVVDDSVIGGENIIIDHCSTSWAT